MSCAGNRRPYLGETVHYAKEHNLCRAAIITMTVDNWSPEGGSALTVFPVGMTPVPVRGCLNNEDRAKDTWHYAH